MTYKFSKKSIERLKQVHPDLVKVVTRAIELSEVDFSVICGVRSMKEQRILVAEGKSRTLNSKHLVQSDGYSHAIDLAPYPINWKLEFFYPIMEAMRKAAKELNINVRWGGAWVNLNTTSETPEKLIQEYSRARRQAGNKVFIDAPHFELVKN